MKMDATERSLLETHSIPAIARRESAEETGQGLVEYALILVLVAVVVVVVLTSVAPRVSELFQAAITAISDAPSYLQIGLIVALLIPLVVWLVRLAPQLPKVLGTDVRQLELTARDYRRVESEITVALLETGRARRKDVGLSAGLWDLSVQRYVEQHREARIHYDDRRRAIVAANADALGSLGRLWPRLELSPPQSEVERIVIEALGLLARALSGIIVAVPQDILQDRGRLYVLDLAPWDSPLPSQLPVLVWLAAAVPGMGEIEQLSRRLLSQFGAVRRVAVLIDLAGDDPARRTSMPELLEKLRQVFAYDFVPLGQEEIARILIARKPRAALAHLVLPHVNLISISPFVLTGPAPDTMFFGRELEMRKIAERIASNSYVLIAGRRFGKSSVLLRLHRVRLPAAGFRTIYHDCSTTPTAQALLSATIRDWRPEPPSDSPLTFADLLRSPPDDSPLVLLLDEADKLVPADRADGWRLFNMLRALSNSGRAQIVLSGERTLRDALRDPGSPLFNFANEVLLGPLDRRAAEELVTRPLQQLEIDLVDEAAIVRRIYDFTSGHPNVVQRLCHRLIERLNERGTRRVTLDDANAVIKDPGFLRNDFLSTYWEAATSLEKIISLLMADDEDLHTLRAVRRALLERCDLRPRAHEVDAALQRLVDLRFLLRRAPAGYEFAVEAFPLVAAGTMTLDDMLEILAEEYQEQRE
ncbi:MAG: ATP-binding protein [Chloroflexota bacterium]|nr:ATP-binding protein [Chloroflexota bacterium]